MFSGGENARALLEESPNAEFWLDEDMTVRYASAAAALLAGVSVEMLAGMAFCRLVCEKDRGDCESWLTGAEDAPLDCRLAAGQAAVRLYRRCLAGDPGGIRVSVVLQPAPDQDRRLGNMAAALAHDFNNTLGSAAVFGQLLKGSNLPAELAAFVDHLLVACRLGQNFTANLQIFSGRRTPRPSSLALAAVVHELEPVLRGMVQEECTLVFEFADPAEPIQADRFMVEQALINLVQNAREAMLEGGRMTVRCMLRVLENAAVSPDGQQVAAGRYMVLAVQDEGRGIARQDLGRIFDATYTTKQSKADIGLGLWVVRRIMQMTGGHVLVDSAIDHGSTFSLLFPV